MGNARLNGMQSNRKRQTARKGKPPTAEREKDAADVGREADMPADDWPGYGSAQPKESERRGIIHPHRHREIAYEALASIIDEPSYRDHRNHLQAAVETLKLDIQLLHFALKAQGDRDVPVVDCAISATGRFVARIDAINAILYKFEDGWVVDDDEEDQYLADAPTSHQPSGAAIQ
ncbi:MAG TPA: hypothetical protein VK540_26720 [Polyangiaceae bacterium]|nr:hypothetical protein [Polyangiaceae bacterium]